MSVEDRIRQQLGPNVGIAHIQSRLALSNHELLSYVAKLGAVDFQELVRETLQYIQHEQSSVCSLRKDNYAGCSFWSRRCGTEPKVIDFLS